MDILSTLRSASKLAKDIQTDINLQLLPPSETVKHNGGEVVYPAILKGTRDYIERVGHQINRCYANSCYDACAVMIRRLLETLIIECFEKHGLQQKIKGKDGEYMFLKELIPLTISESTWTLGRGAKQVLPKLKDVGDKSAHSRRFNAHREDIDAVKVHLRDAVQELVSIADLKSKSTPNSP